MKHGRLLRTNPGCVINKVCKTTNFLERMRGLLGRPQLRADEGLLIVPCSSIHTFWMSYPIDVLFLDGHLNIIKVVESMRPWRMAASRASSQVLELASGSINNLQLDTGQQLEWQDDRDI